MKKVLLMLACCGMLVAANAQGDKKEAPKAEKKEKAEGMKDHVCNKSCTKEKHAYMHGEKGHTCTDACKKKM